MFHFGVNVAIEVVKLGFACVDGLILYVNCGKWVEMHVMSLVCDYWSFSWIIWFTIEIMKYWFKVNMKLFWLGWFCPNFVECGVSWIEWTDNWGIICELNWWLKCLEELIGVHFRNIASRNTLSVNCVNTFLFTPFFLSAWRRSMRWLLLLES